MSYTLTSGLYLRTDTTPAASTLAPSAVLVDGVSNTLQLLEDGVDGKWTDNLSVGADLGDVQLVREIVLQNVTLAAETGVSAFYGWNNSVDPLTVQVYKSDDNVTWTAVEIFAPPDLAVLAGHEREPFLTFSIAVPFFCRYLKLHFVSGTTTPIKYQFAAPAYCTEILVSGNEGSGEAVLLPFSADLEYIPTTGESVLHPLFCWENIAEGNSSLYLFEVLGREGVQASGVSEIEFFRSEGFGGALGVSDLLLLESEGFSFSVNTAVGVCELFSIVSEAEQGTTPGRIFLLESDGLMESLPDLQGNTALFMFTAAGRLSLVNTGTGTGNLFLLGSESLSMEVTGSGNSWLYLLRSKSVTYTAIELPSGGSPASVTEDVILEYYNAY